MTDFNGKLHNGDLNVRQRGEDEPAAGRFAFSWTIGLPTDEDPQGTVTISGTLPPDFAGEGREPSLEGATQAAAAVVTEQIGKQYPALLTA